MMDSTPLLDMRGIVKSFPGVQALRGVDLNLHEGEVLALLGENGAGKSTLIKILGGACRADQGNIFIHGKPTDFTALQDAQESGIAVIYQEFNLVPTLTAYENIFLGHEVTRFGFVSHRKERQQALALFQRMGVEIDVDIPCRSLSTAQQQLVEIAKALAFKARIIVMDEPSATLTSFEVGRLFEIIRDLKRQGIGIIYISHRLEEVTTIADRVSVLRDGQNVGEKDISQITRPELIEMMVGRPLKDEFPSRNSPIGTTRLKINQLRRGREVQDVSFSVRRGEILALTGLVGAGRTETGRLIFGADVKESGEIWLDGKLLDIRSPRDAIAMGIGFLTEDRKLQGLVLMHPVRDNFGLPNLGWLSRFGFVQQQFERDHFSRYIELLKIKIPHMEQVACNLSGGNQQKVVLAKWLARNCDILIFDEPTRGIDVGAKFEIYKLMNELVASGKSVIMISSEFPEVLGMADRVIVMHDGKITGEITDMRSATQEHIMQLAVA